MRPASIKPPFRRAWSLVEMMIVLVIVILLCLMAYRGYSVYVKRGEAGACVQRIANFGKGLQAYLSEHGQWPQEDVLKKGGDGKPPEEDVLWDWWFKQLKDQGISEDDWYCPSDLSARKEEEKRDQEENKNETGFKPAIKDPSYIPSKFDPGPYAPLEDANFPWAIERTGHYDGMRKVMPNGTVQIEFNFKAIKNRSPGGG
jgi:type II secretory pathway pseudopilin PulG